MLVCVCDLILSSTYHFLTDDLLQSTDRDQQESRAVVGKPHVPYDNVVKFDIY